MKTPTPLSFILLDEPDRDNPAEVAIISGKDSCHYYVASLSHEWGQAALRFRKVYVEDGSDKTESQYDLILDGVEDSCSCKGFQRHQGTKTCDKCGGYGHKDGEVCPDCGGSGLFCCKHLKCARWLLDQNLDLPKWRDWPDQMVKVRIAE